MVKGEGNREGEKSGKKEVRKIRIEKALNREEDLRSKKKRGGGGERISNASIDPRNQLIGVSGRKKALSNERG